MSNIQMSTAAHVRTQMDVNIDNFSMSNLAYSQNLVPTLFFSIIFHWLFQINQQIAESDSARHFASGSI